uniref:AI-2E family transporter n=1 Tax=Acetatifactor sp. TaxID=1872090 RepID=UPI004056AE54
MVKKLKTNKLFILLLLTGAVYFFLEYMTPLVAPVLVAMLFVTIFGPLFKKLQEKLHIHRQVSAIILLLLVAILLMFLLWILFSWIVGSLPMWFRNLDQWEQGIAVVVQSVCRTVGNGIGVDSAYLEETLLGNIYDGIDYVQYHAIPGMLSQSLSYVKTLASVGGFLITFIIAAVLLAKDYDDIMNRMLDREECHVFLEVICGIIRYIATFVKAQLIIISTMAAIASVVLGITGIKHGVLWGILAGLLDSLPFVGTGIVLIPLALVQLFYGYYGKAVVCIALFIFCIFLRELLEPRLIGRRIGVKPIAVLLSIYAGIQLFGIWGIIKGPLGFVIIYETYMSLQRRQCEREVQKNMQEEEIKHTMG